MLAILFLLAYPLLIWAMSRARREGIGPMSGSAIPVALTPLFVALGTSWLDLTNAIRGMAIAGAGRQAIVIGIAETYNAITFGGCVTVIVSAILWARELLGRRDRHETPRFTSRSTVRIAAGLAIFFLLLLSAHLFITGTVGDDLGQTPILFHASLTGAVLSIAGGLASFGWLVLSRRQPGAQIHTSRAAIAASATIAAGLVAGSSWFVAKTYMAIVMHGSG